MAMHDPWPKYLLNFPLFWNYFLFTVKWKLRTDVNKCTFLKKIKLFIFTFKLGSYFGHSNKNRVGFHQVLRSIKANYQKARQNCAKASNVQNIFSRWGMNVLPSKTNKHTLGKRLQLIETKPWNSNYELVKREKYWWILSLNCKMTHFSIYSCVSYIALLLSEGV